MNIGRAVRAGRVKMKKGQDRTGKKSQKCYISPIRGEAPTGAIYIKNCVVSDVLYVIACVKFQKEFFRGNDFYTGSKFSIFLLISEWALQQCSSTALSVTA